MRKFPRTLLHIMLSFALLNSVCLSFLVNNAHSETYLGEYCWKLHVPDEEGSYIIGKFAVNDVGNGHYTLNGRYSEYENGTIQDQSVAHGNAELIGNNIICTIVSTFYQVSLEDGLEYGYNNVMLEINTATFNGVFRAINTVYEYQTARFRNEQVQGAIEYLPNCQ